MAVSSSSSSMPTEHEEAPTRSAALAKVKAMPSRWSLELLTGSGDPETTADREILGATG